MQKNKEKEIAEWMLQRLEAEKYLYQEVIVYEIASKYGNEYTHINDNGNLAISRKVLKEFRILTEDSVIWERGERYWRKRERFDDPDRRSTY